MEFKCRLGQQIFLPPPCNQSVGGGKMRRAGEGVEESPFSVGTSFRHIIVPPLHPP